MNDYDRLIVGGAMVAMLLLQLLILMIILSGRSAGI